MDDFGKQNYKTMNNQLLIDSLKTLGIPNAEATGRNDLNVDGKKISGSAYKLKLGSHKAGKLGRSLHHGTMLLNLDLNALGRYLSPNKKKMQSKGVDSVINRVMNLAEVAPEIDHAKFCASLSDAFAERWAPLRLNKTVLKESELRQIPELMQIYEEYNRWDWRFGKTPDFRHNLEHKFDWALLDVQFNVEKGKIVDGRIFSDCLVPLFIDALNEKIASGQYSYDVEGVTALCNGVAEDFADVNYEQVREVYIPQLREWLAESI